MKGLTQQVTVESLLAERARLLDVIEEAKTAKTLIASIDRLIALYGAGSNGNGALPDLPAVPRPGPRNGHKYVQVPCPECGVEYGRGPGLAVHMRKVHGMDYPDELKHPNTKSKVKKGGSK